MLGKFTLPPLFIAFILLILNAAEKVDASDPCQTVPVQPCETGPFDIMILLDASESIDQTDFNTLILDYIQTFTCMMNPNFPNRLGLATFASQSRMAVQIELAQWTDQQWFDEVDRVRGENICCSCCTPLAEGLLLAEAELDIKQPPPQGRALTEEMIFVVTDGQPWQNTAPNSNPFRYAIPTINFTPAQYTYVAVPEVANATKFAGFGYRLAVLTIPDKNGNTLKTDYFAGIPDPTRTGGGSLPQQCVTRTNPNNGRGVRTCAQMEIPPFPIPSEPLSENLLNSSSLDLTELINNTIAILCPVPPSPTVSPSVTPPTVSPSVTPPTLSPRRQPTTSPSTAQPSFNPTKSPVTPEPTQSPSKSPATPEPSQSPSRSPATPMPTASPTERVLGGIDLYYIIDRSNSMTYIPAACRDAPLGNVTAPDRLACWQLWMAWVKSTVDYANQYPYLGGPDSLGWFDDHPGDIQRGNRVFMYAFACTGHQSIPVAITIAEFISNEADFLAAIARAGQMIPDGGTCPGAAISRTASVVQRSEPELRPFKFAPIMTDGVFYDMPRPREAVQGLFHFDVLTAALAISIPNGMTDFGLTPNEQRVQHNQLLEYVDGVSSRIYDLTYDALPILQDVAEEFMLAAIIEMKALPRANPSNTFWCGWDSPERCLESDPAKTDTGRYCKWSKRPNTGCVPKDWCGYQARTKWCSRDPFCKSQYGKCVVRRDRLPQPWPVA